MTITAEQINAVAFVFEKQSGFELSPEQTDLLETTGYAALTSKQAAEKLIHFLESSQDASEPMRTSAYWSLGKKFDPSLIPFFRQQLAIELEGKQAGPVFQLLINLDELHESVFSLERSNMKNMDDVTENFQDAASYLAAQKD